MPPQNLPYIPEYITVHLGPPSSNAPNVTVPFTDYIKNVASSEIYPTWPENALRANIIAQITFALNRIYTEYYRSRGYDFDITNSTSIDQSFVYGRDIFDSVSRIVDEVFNTYMRRRGTVEPLFSLYCDGVENSRCGGLIQWGSVELANRGLSTIEILRRYYGDDIELVTDSPVQGISESYPGRDLTVGLSGDDVRFIQTRLNRIRRNYPAIPETISDGIYTDSTAAAVRKFQQIFSLPQTGTVDRASWYAILRIYSAVKKLSDLNSEGLNISDVTGIFPENLSIGFSGVGVRDLQYFLSFISEFDPAVSPAKIDGIFGRETERAVISYQKEYGLPATGVVDRSAWTSIYNSYLTLLSSLPPFYFSDSTEPYPGYPIRMGSRGEYVLRIQNYLNLISETYPEIPRLDADGIFGNATRSAVIAYQRLFGIDPTGVVAATTYNSIAGTYRTLYDERKNGK